MKYCAQCGKQANDEAIFCGFCGYQFVDVPQSPNKRPQISKVEPAKKKDKMSMLIAVTIIIVGFAAMIYMLSRLHYLSSDKITETSAKKPLIISITGKLPQKQESYEFIELDWFSSPENFCRNFDRLTNLQKEKAYDEVVGNEIHWEGTVDDVNHYEVKLSADHCLCFNVFLKNIPEEQAAKLNKDQMIEFNGVIIKAGVDILCDSVDVNVDTLAIK